MNFEKEYWTEVFEPMVASYERGETPNPDVGCNRWVKFGGLLRRLEAMEARSNSPGTKSRWWLATGHYANIGYPQCPTFGEISSQERETHLLRSRDTNKDQTYFLSTLSPDCLHRLIFPLAMHNLTKPDVYSLARRYKLPGWAPGEPERSESMGLCFVEPGGGGQGASGFTVFLNEFLEPNPGDVVVGPELPNPDTVILEQQEGRPKNDTVGSPPRARRRKEEVEGNYSPEEEKERVLKPGTVIGRHQGLWTATVGEKAHLNLPQGDVRYQGRWYVSCKDPEKNQIEVVRGWGNGRLWSSGMVVRDFYWLGNDCKEIAVQALSAAPPPLPQGFRVKAEEAAGGEQDVVEAEDSIWEEKLVIQFRHRQKPVRVTSIEVAGEQQNGLQSDLVKILFETPQRAVTPGQNAAIWWGERCLGGGIIEEIVQSRLAPVGVIEAKGLFR